MTNREIDTLVFPTIVLLVRNVYTNVLYVLITIMSMIEMYIQCKPKIIKTTTNNSSRNVETILSSEIRTIDISGYK